MGAKKKKDVKILKGKALASVSIGDPQFQAAEAPGNSQVLTFHQNQALCPACPAAQPLLFYDYVSHTIPILLRYKYVLFIFPFKRDNVFDNLFTVTTYEDNDTQNYPSGILCYLFDFAIFKSF